MRLDEVNEIAQLKTIMPQLRALGVNRLVLEINYNFAFRKRPKLIGKYGPPMTPQEASELATLASSLGIILIPQFNCLGHQSDGAKLFPLLTEFTDFREVAEPYCISPRSWCPTALGIWDIAYELIGDIAAAFGSKYVHVGMEEVLTMGQCHRCRDSNAARLFALSVNELFNRLSADGIQMLMWGDRLLSKFETEYPANESSDNGTAPAIDLISTDIIICDWHYSLPKAGSASENYPSIDIFTKRNFRVWPCGWKDAVANTAFSSFARDFNSDKVIGYLASTWAVEIPKLPKWEPLLKGIAAWTAPKQSA